MNGNEQETAKYSIGKIGEYCEAGNYGRAFAHFILLLELDQYNPELLEEFFVLVARKWCGCLERNEEIQNVRFCYTQALRYFPYNLELLNDFGAHYCRCNEASMAIKYFEKAHDAHPDHLKTEKNLQSMYASKVPQWHFRMLNDQVRNEAYKTAIQTILRDYKHHNSSHNINVVDIGTGSGLLSLFAGKYAQLNKIHQKSINIVAIEECEIMSQVAQKVFCANDAQITLIPKLSTEITKQNIFNVLITEIFDCCLFGEGVLTTLIHAHSELLAEHAIVLPYSARLFIFGIESDQVDSKFRYKPQSSDDCYFKAPKCIKNKHLEPYDAYSINLFDYKQVTTIQEVGNINFNDAQQLRKIYFVEDAFDDVVLEAVEDGVCHAFVICFELSLDKQKKYKITTNPLERENVCLCWEQGVVFPAHSITVKKQDKLTVHVEAIADKLNVTLKNQHITAINKTNECAALSPNVNLPCSHLRNECHCWQVSFDAVPLLNWKQLHVAYKHVLNAMCPGSELREVHILEISALPLFSTMFLNDSTRFKDMASIVVAYKNAEYAKKLLQMNGIAEDRYKMKVEWNNLRLLEELEERGHKFNYIVFDPVFQNGLLNEKFFMNIDSYRSLLSPGGIFLPEQLHLCFELVESSYLEQCTQALDGNSFGFNIESAINRYSVLEMRSLSGRFQKKVLSNIVKTSIIYDEKCHEHVVNVRATEDGTLSGFLYWFEWCAAGVVISTRNSPYNMAAFVLNAFDKERIYKDGIVDVKIKQDCGLLKISLR